MPFQNLQDGLYLLRQRSREKGVDHYGVLDVGNCLGCPTLRGADPNVIHQTPPCVQIDSLQATGTWWVLGRIVDEAAAIARIDTALKSPRYDLLGNNCEHFARFVVTGRRESPQLQGALVAIGLTAFVVMALSTERKSA